MKEKVNRLPQRIDDKRGNLGSEGKKLVGQWGKRFSRGRVEGPGRREKGERGHHIPSGPTHSRIIESRAVVLPR